MHEWFICMNAASNVCMTASPSVWMNAASNICMNAASVSPPIMLGADSDMQGFAAGTLRKESLSNLKEMGARAVLGRAVLFFWRRVAQVIIPKYRVLRRVYIYI